MLATDLEPSGARRIFPGWDEPAFKATFSLSVTVPSNFRAVSNMPVIREHADGASRKIVTFAATPRMSSYLFVLAAGEYDRIATTVDGRRYRRRPSQSSGCAGPLRARRGGAHARLFQ